MKIKLSIVNIFGNEETVITDCLKSALWADEIILIAANSTDNTKKIVKKIAPKAKIFETSDEYNKNFSKWRNLGYENATGDWILYLDSDERITPDLKTEIKTLLKSNTPQTYYVIPRANYFLGQRVRYGNTYPDYVKRLFNKKYFKGFKGTIHEEPDVIGAPGYLKSNIIHLTHRNLSSMLQKTIAWTDVEAKQLYKNHHPPIVWWRFLRMMLTKFWQRIIKEQFWRDGTVGWISGIFEMFDTFIIYARTWELQKNEKSSHL